MVSNNVHGGTFIYGGLPYALRSAPEWVVTLRMFIRMQSVSVEYSISSSL
jgi:hypothetical protein